MRKLNRKNLTKFLKRIVRNKKVSVTSAAKLLSNFDSASTSQDYSPEIHLEDVEMRDETNDFDNDDDDEIDERDPMEDEAIDHHVKDLLKERRNGQYLPGDIVAHLEFFYNTLIVSHKTENPFGNPNSYPALLYKDNNSPDTLLEMHRRLIFPSDCTSSYNDSKLSYVSPLEKKYDWYPNRQIESPMSV